MINIQKLIVFDPDIQSIMWTSPSLYDVSFVLSSTNVFDCDATAALAAINAALNSTNTAAFVFAPP